MKNKVIRKRNILWYALPCITVWVLYLLAFFPGIMTYDSTNQWQQIVDLKFSNWHPAIHTWLLWAVTRVWYSPAAMGLTQILILAFTFGYGMFSLERTGSNKFLLFTVTVLFALNVVNGILVITLWKDVLFSTSLLLFTFVLMNIVISKGAWLNKRWNLFIFAVASLGVLLLRHNGILSVIPTLLLLLYFYRDKLKQLILIFGIIISTYFLITGPIYSYMRVEPAFEGEAFSVPLNVLGTIVTYHGELTNEQKSKINQIMSLDEWSKVYNPFFADPIKGRVNYDAFVKDKVGFFTLLLDVCVQNPRLAIKGFGNLTSLVWKITEAEGAYTATPPTEIQKNSLNLKNKVISPSLHAFLKQTYINTQSDNLRWLFWRPALPLYLICLFCLLSVIKNGKNSILIGLPVIFNNVSVLIALPAQDFRYLYANTLIVLPVIVFSFIHYNCKQID